MWWGESDRAVASVGPLMKGAEDVIAPPEWEIDPEVMDGMVGGYRRIKDGARLQKHARLGVWVLAVGHWVINRIEAIDPPLSWADGVFPIA